MSKWSSAKSSALSTRRWCLTVPGATEI
jgi:hypothetical protein